MKTNYGDMTHTADARCHRPIAPPLRPRSSPVRHGSPVQCSRPANRHRPPLADGGRPQRLRLAATPDDGGSKPPRTPPPRKRRRGRRLLVEPR